MAAALRVAFVSSYPPRACGIATFTQDLSTAVAASGRGPAVCVAAITEPGAHYRFPATVRWVLDQGDQHIWRRVAQLISASSVDVVSIQHEFGLYGRFEVDGRFIDALPYFLAALDKPLVTTLHTVLPQPHPTIRAAMRTLVERSEAVVTMIDAAAHILAQDYGLHTTRVHTIPHGVPLAACGTRESVKGRLHLHDAPILSTFGLLSSGKGIEYMLRALPQVVRRYPELRYLVIGETHPGVRRMEGEQYRESLIDLVTSLHLEQHVRFIDRYLDQQEVMAYLQATDIYITPYVNPHQVASGTLAYALGCGKAVVSTPYIYATEVLANGRGLLAAFRDPDSLARCVAMLLDDPQLRARLEERALAYGRLMAWPTVGAQYAQLFRDVVAESRPVALAAHARVAHLL